MCNSKHFAIQEQSEHFFRTMNDCGVVLRIAKKLRQMYQWLQNENVYLPTNEISYEISDCNEKWRTIPWKMNFVVGVQISRSASKQYSLFVYSDDDSCSRFDFLSFVIICTTFKCRTVVASDWSIEHVLLQRQ